ncbi:hypothetical protein DZB90_17930 [Bacillus thuringiensis]|nr:hypothetical protein DZB90_17930 [Bacillus thuringiensis]
MDGILERGLSFINYRLAVLFYFVTLVCFYAYNRVIFNKKSPGSLINKVPKAFNTTLCRVPRLTRVELDSIIKSYYISV